MTDWLPLSEVLRNIAIVVGGVVGLLLAGFRVHAANRQADAAQRTAELARRDHVAELFNRAVGQLHDDNLHVRLGAIYTLRQISEDFPDLSAAVFELMSLYIREKSTNYGDDEPPVELRVMMEFLVSQMDKEQ